jgi:hypothetical protein
MRLITIFLLICSCTAWSKEPNAQAGDKFISPGKHKIEINYEGIQYTGTLTAFQNGDGSWTVAGIPAPNANGTEIRVLGTMNQLFDPNIINEFVFTGSIFINGKKLNSPIVNTGDMVLVKKRGKSYFQSDENKCRQQEENRPMSSCIFFEGSSYFRFYP